MRIPLILLSPLVATGFVLPAFAHHGWGGNEEKITELTGTVVKPVSLAGPHATMQIRANNVVWDITLAPPARTSAAGLRENSIPVGATVTVRGNRNLEPDEHEMKVILVVHGNRRYAVYPERQ
jgi:hypothetical protein